MIIVYVIEVVTHANGRDADTSSAESFDRLDVAFIDGNLRHLKEIDRMHIFEDSAILLVHFIDHGDSFIEYDYNNFIDYHPMLKTPFVCLLGTFDH